MEVVGHTIVVIRYTMGFWGKKRFLGIQWGLWVHNGVFGYTMVGFGNIMVVVGYTMGFWVHNVGCWVHNGFLGTQWWLLGTQWWFLGTQWVFGVQNVFLGYTIRVF